MIKVVHKIFAIGLAFLVFCSTVSFTLEKHFCGNVLVDTALFTTTNKCCSDTAATKQLAADKIAIKNNCCKDTVELIKGQNDLNVKTLDQLKIKKPVLHNDFVYTKIQFFNSLPQLIIPYQNYLSPNLFADIQVRYQVFII